MKKFIRPFSLVLPFISFFQSILYGQDDVHNSKEKKYEFVKKKAVNKSYNVSAADKLNIQNSFGSVEVTTWDKNEIKVDVNIEVSANTDVLAQKILDRISVNDAQKGKEISFKTEMKDINTSKGEKSTMTINYTISMPSSNPLKIKNEFGTTTLPDFKGEVDLTSKFGKLNTGNLSNVKNISVEFGTAKLGNIPGGNLDIKYSGASIARLSGNIKMNLEFSSKVVLNLDNNLASLDLNTSYSTLNLKPMGDLPATYAISTSFGSFKNKTAIKFTSDEDKDDSRGPKFDNQYDGKSGNGNVPVKVKSSFSSIILGEATEEELKGKDKDKDKQKKKQKTVTI